MILLRCVRGAVREDDKQHKTFGYSEKEKKTQPTNFQFIIHGLSQDRLAPQANGSPSQGVSLRPSLENTVSAAFMLPGLPGDLATHSTVTCDSITEMPF